MPWAVLFQPFGLASHHPSRDAALNRQRVLSNSSVIVTPYGQDDGTVEYGVYPALLLKTFKTTNYQAIRDYDSLKEIHEQGIKTKGVMHEDVIFAIDNGADYQEMMFTEFSGGLCVAGVKLELWRFITDPTPEKIEEAKASLVDPCKALRDHEQWVKETAASAVTA